MPKVKHPSEFNSFDKTVDMLDRILDIQQKQIDRDGDRTFKTIVYISVGLLIFMTAIIFYKTFVLSDILNFLSNMP